MNVEMDLGPDLELDNNHNRISETSDVKQNNHVNLKECKKSDIVTEGR